MYCRLNLIRCTVVSHLVDNGYVDCIVQLSGQLFANTQIPCTLWFLSKNRNGEKGYRKRTEEILFIDARKLGALIPGSRKQKQLSDEDIARVASVYHAFKHEGTPDSVPGFCRVAKLGEVVSHKYALTPGRYVGSGNGDDDDDYDFEEKMKHLAKRLDGQFAESARLEQAIKEIMREFADER